MPTPAPNNPKPETRNPEPPPPNNPKPETRNPELPALPMACYYRDNESGEHEFIVSALQPANCALLFEWSTDLAEWKALGFWGAYVEDQQVTVMVVTRNPTAYVRATPKEPLWYQTRSAGKVLTPEPGRWHLLAEPPLCDSITVEPPLTLTQLKESLKDRMSALPELPPPQPHKSK